MRKEFNPQEWLDKAKADQSRQPSSSITGGQASPRPITPSSPRPLVPSSPRPITPSSSDLASEVDQVVTRIEADLTDIATCYADWVNVGFAFVHEFGEAGRTFYHRVSRFYTGYTKSETDKQYDQCLKSQGGGITIKTFFHLAQQAGVDVGIRNQRGRGGEGEMGRGGERAMGRDREDDQGANGTSGSDQSQYAEAPNQGDSLTPWECNMNSV